MLRFVALLIEDSTDEWLMKDVTLITGASSAIGAVPARPLQGVPRGG